MNFAQGKRILFTEGQDLNTVITIGEYYTNTDALANSLVNRPSILDGKLYGCSMSVHASGNGKIVQMLHTMYGDHERVTSNGGITWSTWQRLATENDLQTCIKKVEYTSLTSGSEISVINPVSNRPQVVMLCGNSGSGDVQTYAFGIRTVNPNAVQRNKNYITWIKAPPSNIVFTLSDTDLTKIKIDYTGNYSLHLYLWT